MRLMIFFAMTISLSSCISIPKKPEMRRTFLNIYKTKKGVYRAFGDSEYKGKREKILELDKLDKNICIPSDQYIKSVDWTIKVLELLKSEIYK